MTLRDQLRAAIEAAPDPDAAARKRPFRVLVCGGREFANAQLLWHVLGSVEDVLGPITLVIHGAARGADTLADEWATRHDVPVMRFPANWKKHGKAAGPIRNQRMLDEGKPDLVVAMAGGKGTADMIDRALNADIEVWGHAPRLRAAGRD